MDTVFIEEFKAEIREHDGEVYYDIFEKERDGIYTFIGSLHTPYIGRWKWVKNHNTVSCNHFMILLKDAETYLLKYIHEGEYIFMFQNELGIVRLNQSIFMSEGA